MSPIKKEIQLPAILIVTIVTIVIIIIGIFYFYLGKKQATDSIVNTIKQVANSNDSKMIDDLILTGMHVEAFKCAKGYKCVLVSYKE